MLQRRKPPDDRVGHADAPDIAPGFIEKISKRQHGEGGQQPLRSGGLTGFGRAPQTNQIRAEIRCGLISKVAVLLERPHDRLVESRRNVAANARRRRRVGMENRRADHGARRAVESRPTRRGLVQHEAEREEIAARVDGLAAQLLG